MCLEGLCGGSAYVNTFYHVGREGEDGGEGEEGMRRKMEKEFRIGAVGAADSCGMSGRLNRVKVKLTFGRYSICLAHLHADRSGLV